MEKIGRGTLKIVEACKEAVLKSPTWKNMNNTVILSFSNERSDINKGAFKGLIEGAVERSRFASTAAATIGTILTKADITQEVTARRIKGGIIKTAGHMITIPIIIAKNCDFYVPMLTLYQFKVLDDDQKAEAVWQGTFLGDQHEKETVIQLYSVGNFFVEVFYDQVKNEITRFRSFKTPRLLDPYIRKFKI